MAIRARSPAAVCLLARATLPLSLPHLVRECFGFILCLERVSVTA